MLLGASVDGGAANKMVDSDRTGAEGDFLESRSGITEAFPVHIITHAFRKRVDGGRDSRYHSNYETIKMMIRSSLHFL